MAGDKANERTVEVGLVLGIAEALREEFGISIDAHPGGPGNEAGVVNRALRAAVSRILKTIVPASEDLEGVVTWALRYAALRRLGEAGIAEEQAKSLVNSEPGQGDAWLACVTLAPASVLDDVIDDGIVTG